MQIMTNPYSHCTSLLYTKPATYAITYAILWTYHTLGNMSEMTSDQDIHDAEMTQR